MKKSVHKEKGTKKSIKKVIPNFSSEEEERDFWDSHDSTQYIDWRDAKQGVF